MGDPHLSLRALVLADAPPYVPLARLLAEQGITRLDVYDALEDVTTDTYVLAAKEDHIAPWKSTYMGARLLGGPVKFILGGSGHIAGIVNPPQKHRRNFWTNELLTDDADDWFSRAAVHPGSWWPHWSAWLSEHGGSRRPAPVRAGSDAHPALAPAPGSYVSEQVA